VRGAANGFDRRVAGVASRIVRRRRERLHKRSERAFFVIDNEEIMGCLVERVPVNRKPDFERGARRLIVSEIDRANRVPRTRFGTANRPSRVRSVSP